MKISTGIATLCIASAIFTHASHAQDQTQPPANPLDVIPAKIPFDMPYGAPILLDRAQALVQSAMAEANKRGWPMNVAVSDSGSNLLAFARMDGAVLAAAAISQHTSPAAVTFLRPTNAYDDAQPNPNLNYLLPPTRPTHPPAEPPPPENGQNLSPGGVRGNPRACVGKHDADDNCPHHQVCDEMGTQLRSEPPLHVRVAHEGEPEERDGEARCDHRGADRTSTGMNSSHRWIADAVFC